MKKILALLAVALIACTEAPTTSHEEQAVTAPYVVPDLFTAIVAADPHTVDEMEHTNEAGVFSHEIDPATWIEELDPNADLKSQLIEDQGLPCSRAYVEGTKVVIPASTETCPRVRLNGEPEWDAARIVVTGTATCGARYWGKDSINGPGYLCLVRRCCNVKVTAWPPRVISYCYVDIVGTCLRCESNGVCG